MKIDPVIFYQTLPALAILVIVECIEMVIDRRFGKDKNDMFASICIGIVAIGISGGIKTTVFFIYSWMYQFRLFTIPANAWWAWLICFFADDVSYYWFHRLSHQVRFLWASHSVHHSAESYTFLTALRLPWTSNITGTFLFWAWIPLIGISPAIVITMKSISALYQFWLHTERIKKLPRWFEFIFNTPSHHRVHHASDADYLDKNHGGTLMLCDRLFGTFLEETHKPAYGLTKKIASSNPVVIAFNEWVDIVRDIKNAVTFGEALNFVFNNPGWNNDGKG